MKTITLTDKEYKLFKMILEEAEEDRGNCGCNDAIDTEEKLFTQKERDKILKDALDDDSEYMFNVEYVTYLLYILKNGHGVFKK